ncbi:MAG TPA: flagellar basal body-associated FliL family protein [bacterium]|jgi:flagellar FliL protein|nr:flagellar basal body-associated FliL family protein [bacterium]
MAEQNDKGAKGLLNVVLILSLVSLLGIIGLGIGMYMLWASKTQPKETKVIEQKPEPGKIYDMGTFIVNLADEEVSRYARTQIQLEYSKVNLELDNEIKERDPQIKDLINTLLNDRKSAELSTSEGKERFRRELQLKINQILKYGAITNIYLTQFAIQ